MVDLRVDSINIYHAAFFKWWRPTMGTDLQLCIGY